MKRIVLSALLALTFTGSAFSTEKLSDVALEAKIQEGISLEISHISEIQTIEDLAADYATRCQANIDKLEKAGAEKKVLDNLAADCNEKIKKLETMGIETAKAALIAQLQDAQTAENIMFTLSQKSANCAVDCYYGFERFWGFVLFPFALATDIVVLPVSFLISLYTGF